MPDDKPSDKTERGNATAIGCAVLAVLSPPAYVLSVGPYYWLLGHGYISASVEVIYFPLALVCHLLPPLHDAVEWYVSLWQ
jgi:hypothetical protein